MASQEVRFMSNLDWDEDVLDGISVRKELMLHRFRITQQRGSSKINSLISIYEKSPKKILKALEKTQADSESPMDYFSRKPPLVVFQVRKGKQHICDFVCVEYARFQQISSNRDSILRYTYFELYFENCIVSCLANMATLRSNGGFSALDLDAAGWASAKQQMLYWNNLFYPDLEMLSKPPRILTPALCDRFTYWEQNANLRDRARNILEIQERESTCYQSDDNIVWPLVTYLALIQLLPILPRKLIPAFQINYVCEETILKDFAEKLQHFLTSFCELDPILNGDIVYTEVPLSARDAISGASVPYILRVTKNAKKQNTIKEISDFAAMSKKDWASHPFLNRVPIMVSTEEYQNSAVMNIPVKKRICNPSGIMEPNSIPKCRKCSAPLHSKVWAKEKRGRTQSKKDSLTWHRN